MPLDFNAFRVQKYTHNKSFVSLIGCDENGYILKIVTMKTVRNSGVECDDGKGSSDGFIYDSKLSESVSRSKSKIFELAMCNPWDYFFTGTLSPDKYNRYDLDKFHKDLTQFFRDQNKKYNCKIRFLLIPEKHKDGAWHMHGLIGGLSDAALHKFQIGDKMSSEIAYLINKGDIIYNWSDYSNKFGFTTLGKVKNRQAVNKYITKYITKDLSCSVSAVGAHMYYRSRDLQEAVKIKEGFMSAGTNIKPNYENDYCTVIELPYDEKTLSDVLSLFE